MVHHHSLCCRVWPVGAVLTPPRSIALPPMLLLDFNIFVQKSSTRSSRHRYSSPDGETESCIKLQFVDLAGSECIGKPVISLVPREGPGDEASQS